MPPCSAWRVAVVGQAAYLSAMPNDPPVNDFRFEALLKPHRSLSQRGFWILMGVASVFSFATGIVFALQGAWPIFGFCGLDIAILYIAFRASYRQAAWRELIELKDHTLTVTRISPSGQRASWSFQPYWLQIAAPAAEAGGDLVLRSHGRSLAIGGFLSSEEKRDFAVILRDALARYRLSLGTQPALSGLS